MLKLHLGCGKRKIYGWTNVDVDPAAKPDVLDLAEVLLQITDNSVDVIYASHLLEHYSRNNTVSVLKVWFKKLKPGGILRVAVPDFGQVIAAYGKGFRMEQLLGFLVGGQRNDWDCHYMVFDERLLAMKLAEAGFEHIQRYDWNSTEHFYVDDYASCYLPHMDKGTGMLMSLNMECNKPE